MKDQVFILCAGEASRFQGGATKQLLPIDGVSILARTIRQLLARVSPPEIFVVTHRPDIAHEAGKEGAKVIEPADRRFTCSTAASTEGDWRERNVLLCGDVFWTHESLDKFLAEPLPCPTYATDGTDIFGLAWIGPAESWNVSAAFKQVIAEGQPRYGGRLHASRKYLEGAAYLLIKDRTQDFDTREEYENFLKGRSKRRMFVPLRRRCIAKG